MSRCLDKGSVVVAAITLALFVAALFVKGFTHDLFLEAGVFLVSVKIFMMMHANRVALGRVDEKIGIVLKALEGDRDPDRTADRAP